MRNRFRETEVTNALDTFDNELGSFFHSLDIEDRVYVRKLTFNLPRTIQLFLVEQYKAQPTRALANTYLREKVDKISTLIPKILVHCFDSGGGIITRNC